MRLRSAARHSLLLPGDASSNGAGLGTKEPPGGTIAALSLPASVS
ncbi:hypothetical protein ABIE13_004442 [Ottowia thiooxydans]|uniref:Uncharacterized protein n=1 Tax=Ottowia thiooxydans TaxID=219182 RepID=A0ABV2QE59_9BURK